MAKKSAGLLMYRRRHGGLEVFLVHPGGPFWAKKDEGSWSIPKGEYSPGEEPLEVAKREFHEETGYQATGEFIPLTPRKQPSGKVISTWALEGDCDASSIKSNTFSMEWPPRSGKQGGPGRVVYDPDSERKNPKRASPLSGRIERNSEGRRGKK